MRKSELITHITNKTGVEKMIVSRIIDEFAATITNTLLNGEKISFRGFGSFIIKKRAEKYCRDIRKNESILIPEHFVPAFKPSKEMLDEFKNIKL